MDEDGRYFIDRDGDIFALVLDFLRSAGESVPQHCPDVLRRLRIDADFYGLEELAARCTDNLEALATKEKKAAEKHKDVVVRVVAAPVNRQGVDETSPVVTKRRRSEAVKALEDEVFGDDDF